VAVGHIRDVDERDLLGRHQMAIDIDAVAGYLTGRRVLVTGAGGSIGSELCRQINRFGPAQLIMLDRDESALHAVQLSIEGRALLDSPDLVLGDIRDSERIACVFRTCQPQVVFHAAALKHLPLLERAPAEDKAADPCSVLGYSKRVAERLTAHVSGQASGEFISVRFGNVLGSRGSVLETFRAQLAAGGPMTVTDLDATRHFMTVQEAVQLVIQAGAIGAGGEALVLDMGEPVRIADIAERLSAQSRRPVRIVHTGLRPGEKLHEVRLGTGETDRRPVHPLISHVAVPPLSPFEARRLDPTSASEELAASLRDLCLGGATSSITEGRPGGWTTRERAHRKKADSR
jgi:FlaA1/EpsC-like NDP-sugar epimerase